MTPSRRKVGKYGSAPATDALRPGRHADVGARVRRAGRRGPPQLARPRLAPHRDPRARPGARRAAQHEVSLRPAVDGGADHGTLASGGLSSGVEDAEGPVPPLGGAREVSLATRQRRLA